VGDASPMDGSPDGAAAESDADAQPSAPPPGQLLAKAAISDLGELRVVKVDEGFSLRILAGSDKSVSIEPLLRLQGPGKAGLYLGAGCRSVSAGAERVVGIWTGEQARCATEPQPLAVLQGRKAPAGCPVTSAPPGTWTLSVFACGRYAEPAATVSFDLPSTGRGDTDGGAAP